MIAALIILAFLMVGTLLPIYFLLAIAFLSDEVRE
jgi:hypothetical protein